MALRPKPCRLCGTTCWNRTRPFYWLGGLTVFEKRVYRKGEYRLNYAIDFPEPFFSEKQYPIVFYFHGMGNVSTGLDDLINTCPVQRSFLPQDIPCIIVAPSCDDYTWFENFNNIICFIKEMRSQSYADKTRIYLAGSSMGGYTAWTLSFVCPQLFAAGVICCGGGMYAGVRDRVRFPIRAVHGTADTTVLCRESELMADRINRAGGNVELILLEGYGHNVWDVTFSNPNTYRWLMCHHS